MKKVNFFLCFLFIFFLFSTKTFASGLSINEFLAHPSSGNKEWVEFYNPDNVDLSNYYLDDDTDFNSDIGNSDKKNLTGFNNSNPLYPYFEISSFLNNSGDHIVLYSETGQIIDQYEYTHDPGADLSVGRFPDGNGEFQILSSATKGYSNSSPPTPTQAPTATDKPGPTALPEKNTTKTIPTSFTKPTFVSTISQVEKIASNSKKSVLGSKNEPIIKLSGKEASLTAEPTIKDNKKEKEVKTLGVSQTNLPLILIGAGIIFIVFCGILVGLKYRKKILNAENN